MKRILFFALMAVMTTVAMAQEMIVPLTERGFVSAEKAEYQIGDTMVVRGMILSTDYNDFYPYSRYVNVELIGRNDTIHAKQKVRLQENGYFYATMPTNTVHYQGRYFLRAYTQFMCNQSEETFPMNSVNLTAGSSLAYNSSPASAIPSNHRISFRDLQNKLQIYVTDATDGMELYCFQSGFGLIKQKVTAGKKITFDTSQIPDGLLTFWLRSAGKTLDEHSVWVGEIHNQAVSLSEFDDSETKPIVIKRIVDDNSHALHAFESLNIMQHVHSDRPFPESFYRVPADSAKALLNDWLETAHFIGFDLQKAIDGAFEYPFSPEQHLSIKGSAKTMSKKMIEKGTVQIFNVATLDSHVCQLDSVGHFEQAVADFADGNRFYLEAKDKKGKGANNMVAWEDELSPRVKNWLPRLDYSAATLQSTDFHRRINVDPDAIKLDEIEVKGKSKPKMEEMYRSEMMGMYMFDYDELQKPGYLNVRKVLESTGKINFVNETTYGYTMDEKGKRIREERIQPDLVAKWRQMRGLYLNGNGGKWMTILYDNVLYFHGYSTILDMPTTDLESIEIIRPSATDPRLIMNDSQEGGLIIIKTNRKARRLEIPSNGINIKPTGISIPQKDDIPSALPLAPGQHIAVDVITPTQQIISWEE